jgi:hypothetical protein
MSYRSVRNPVYDPSGSCSIASLPIVLAESFPSNDSHLLVADTGERNLFQLQPKTGEIRALLATTMQPVWAVALDPVQHTLYAVVNDGITKINYTNADDTGFIIYHSQASESRNIGW